MEAGEGEEGRDCLLETQEESPSASGRPAQPTPRQLFLKFGSVPAPWAHQGAATEPKGQAHTASLRLTVASSLPEGALAWPGCCPLATRRLTQSPFAFRCCGVWSGSQEPPASLSW